MGLLNKLSWQKRLREFFQRPHFSDESLGHLRDLLLEADIAPALAMRFSEELRQQAVKQKLQSEEQVLQQLVRILEVNVQGNSGYFEELLNSGEQLQVVMMLGVNGVGKTTSLAKLVAYFCENAFIQANELTIGAGDTFRAAAIEQLKVHGERLGVRVVAQEQGSDSAAVIYDAVSSALAHKHKLVLLDTAGRMHTQNHLMDELAKMNRVLDKLIKPEQRHNLIVIDATTGKNALTQAETFHAVLPLKGAVVTKLDSKCGGGIVFSLHEKLGLPVMYEGQGEKYGQIGPFAPKQYVEQLLGFSKNS